jgi:hypothetical protein
MTPDKLRRHLTDAGTAITLLESALTSATPHMFLDMAFVQALRRDPDRTALFQSELHVLRDRLFDITHRLTLIESVVRIRGGGEPPKEERND